MRVVMFCQKPYSIYYFIYNMQLPSFLLEQYGFAVWGGGNPTNLIVGPVHGSVGVTCLWQIGSDKGCSKDVCFK